MAILLIEYRVQDVAGWKAIFDRDPMGRASHGVTGHRIRRDVDDPGHLMVSLEFASADRAKAFLGVLGPVWDMSGATQAWVLEDDGDAAS